MNNKTLNLNLLILKIIAVISMTIDHGYKAGIFETNDINIIIGRLAFPIFAFLTAYGVSITHNISVYRNRLLLTALISIFPYTLYTYLIKQQYFSELNILFTLFSSVYLIESIKNKNILGIFISLSIGLFSDYSLIGVGLVLAFYYIIVNPNEFLNMFSNKVKPFIDFFFLGHRRMTIIIIIYAILSKIFYGDIQLWSLNSFVLIILLQYFVPETIINVHSDIKNVIKYFFYIYYPFHLFAIVIIKIIITSWQKIVIML